MRKSTRPSQQPDQAAKASSKKAGKQPIRKLSTSDDLGLIFSHAKGENSPGSFIDALATGIPAATLAEVLTEKEDQPTSGLLLQEMLRNSPLPQEQIDLHGCTAAEAEIKTENFLTRSRRDHLQTVLVITGKGLHSSDGSVLKDVIETRLKIMKNAGTILAYLWEKKNREKSGAILVYLP